MELYEYKNLYMRFDSASSKFLQEDKSWRKYSV